MRLKVPAAERYGERWTGPSTAHDSPSYTLLFRMKEAQVHRAIQRVLFWGCSRYIAWTTFYIERDKTRLYLTQSPALLPGVESVRVTAVLAGHNAREKRQ
ncbi:hypothetical protein KQX54_021443 [Cotesia glomerata]|uniref:Uncharacterized protein n=1 Tax=Cotesia glomerata TaxID=32391 RepID=A0AAV7J9L5_COTGL|nr:hypothetical protein KQX54_021443 [Cotesia glomerata]